MSLDTGIFASVAIHATAEAAVPVFPAAGSLMSWVGNPSGWTKVAFEFAEDAFKFTEGDRKRIEFWAPALPMKSKVIEKPPAASFFDFVSYEVGHKLYQYCTNMTGVNGVYTALTAHASYKALIIEVGEVGALYFPKIHVEASLPTGGVWSPTTQAGKVEIFGTTALPAGYKWCHFQ